MILREAVFSRMVLLMHSTSPSGEPSGVAQSGLVTHRSGVAVSRASLLAELWLYYIISLFLDFFYQLVFPCRHACSSETHGTIPTSLLVFVENVFTSLVSLLFLECKLHCGTCSLALRKTLC